MSLNMPWNRPRPKIDAARPTPAQEQQTPPQETPKNRLQILAEAAKAKIERFLPKRTEQITVSEFKIAVDEYRESIQSYRRFVEANDQKIRAFMSKMELISRNPKFYGEAERQELATASKALISDQMRQLSELKNLIVKLETDDKSGKTILLSSAEIQAATKRLRNEMDPKLDAFTHSLRQSILGSQNDMEAFAGMYSKTRMS